MAEVIGLGASVIAFATIAAQLSLAISTVWETIKDVPDDIRRVAEELKTLEFILNRVHDQDLTAPDKSKDKVAAFWAEKSDQLEHDFAEYKTLADKLISLLKRENGTISSAKTKIHWFFRQGEIRALEKGLTRHIETFNTVLGFLTYDAVRASTFDIQELKHLNTRSVTKLEGFESITRDEITDVISTWKTELTRSLQQAMPFEPQHPTKTLTNKTTVATCTSSNTWRTYHLPVGTLRIKQGVKILDQNKSWQGGRSGNSVTRELISKITFDFTPESWFMDKALVGTFALHHKKYSDIPSFTQTICSSNLLPPEHAALRAAVNGDIPALQTLFSEGLARPTDRDVKGRTLLHLAATTHRYDMSHFLIGEGADCNAVDKHGRTILHDVFARDVFARDVDGQAIDDAPRLLELYRNSGCDLTTLDRRGRTAFSEGLLESLHTWDLLAEYRDTQFQRVFKLLQDFEEINDFDPLPLSMALCTAYGGSTSSQKVVEGAIKRWLKTHGKGFYDLDDRESYRKVLLQVLKHTASKLTPIQADHVLAYTCTGGSSSICDAIQIVVRPGIATGSRVWGDGNSAFVRAAQFGNLEAVEIFLAAGADPTEEVNEHAFSWAILNGHLQIARRVLDFDYCTPMDFGYVTRAGLIEFASIFLERGFDINKPIGTMLTTNLPALFGAAYEGRLEMVDFLVKNGANVLIRDSNGARASSHAMRRGKSSVAEFLLREEERAMLKQELNNETIAETPKSTQQIPVSIRRLVYSKTKGRCILGPSEWPGFQSTGRAGLIPIHENPTDHYTPRLHPRLRPCLQHRLRPRTESHVEDLDPHSHVEDLDPHSQHIIDSWGSLRTLTNEDILLIASGAFVSLWCFLCISLLQVLGFLWKNRKHVTVKRIKIVFSGFFIFISFTFLTGYLLGRR